MPKWAELGILKFDWLQDGSVHCPSCDGILTHLVGFKTTQRNGPSPHLELQLEFRCLSICGLVWFVDMFELDAEVKLQARKLLKEEA